MIQLFEQDICTNERQSSKGNQLKWKNNHMWYKADYAGYEGLAEYLTAHLLKKSSLKPEEFVMYDIEQICYKSNVFTGVKSRDFLKNGWQIITLERLYQNFFGKSLYCAVYQITSEEKRLEFLVEQTERITGLKNFGVYMNKLFTIDAFFLNEDRHMHNVAVLMNEEGRFAYCPIFDNGAALLSDIKMDYPLGGDTYKYMEQVKAKTICDNFDRQLDVSEMLYGENIKFYFKKEDVAALLEKISGYSDEIKMRVLTVLYMQMRKYKYLF